MLDAVGATDCRDLFQHLVFVFAFLIEADGLPGWHPGLRHTQDKPLAVFAGAPDDGEAERI